MTLDDFKEFRWGAKTMVAYQHEIYDVISVNFQESLVGFLYQDDEDIVWVRCENIEIVMPDDILIN